MLATRTEYRYRVVIDDDSDPVRQWAGQPMFFDDLDEDQRAAWLDPDQWTSHGVVQERRCSCCDQWEELDSVWSFDRHESHYYDTEDGGPVESGTYALEELPEYVACHFAELEQ